MFISLFDPDVRYRVLIVSNSSLRDEILSLFSSREGIDSVLLTVIGPGMEANPSSRVFWIECE